MPDFHQNGVIATLHNFNSKPIEEIEKELLGINLYCEYFKKS